MKALISTLSLLAFFAAATIPSLAFAAPVHKHKHHAVHKASTHHRSHRSHVKA